jgi:hypothetical protein
VDLPVLYTEESLQAFLALDTKSDTLMQSQMFKGSDHKAFIASQVPEIHGLQKMDVFDIQHTVTL